MTKNTSKINVTSHYLKSILHAVSHKKELILLVTQ